MSILVTGGAGYIGSITVEQLVAAGEQVVVYDNLVKGHRAAVDRGAIFVEGDLGDAQLLRATLREHEITAVLHFAAHSQVGESVQQPAKYFANNVANSIALVEAMVHEGAQHLVFSSTAAVYGEPQNIPVSESDPRNPTNPYGEGKMAFERMLPWFESAYGLRYASLRYFNAAGASERCGEAHAIETHVIPLILQVALGQRPAMQIFGGDYPTPDGTPIRDYIHVIDLADAHILALRALADGAASAIYNLGNGQGFSVKELVAAAHKITGHDIPIEIGPPRPGDPAVLIASSDQIRQDLGWEPRFTELDTIIASAWKWHHAHPLGYEE